MPKAVTAEPSARTASQPSAGQTLFAEWLAENIRTGERYVGVILAADGSASHHLFLLPGEKAGVTWKQAVAWAAEIGGDLPTRAEQAVLFGNAKSEFKPNWYWSGEQHASDDDYAWSQDFDYGLQNDYFKSAELRARAVRRLTI